MKKTVKLSVEKVKYLHEIVSRETGGDPNIRDSALLESALEGAFQTFDGVELYPTVEEKAARIGHSLVANHPFVDGNKRIGMLVTLVFLEINGIEINPSVSEVARVGLEVGAGKMKYDELLEWIQANSEK